ncbi:Uncharacterised protein [Mycobacterium tuberculosis]|nr:Uncharacterised protein [Mycobacterium tuberculosis]
MFVVIENGKTRLPIMQPVFQMSQMYPPFPRPFQLSFFLSLRKERNFLH